MQFSLVLVGEDESLLDDAEMDRYVKSRFHPPEQTYASWSREEYLHILGGKSFCRVRERNLGEMTADVRRSASAVYGAYAVSVGDAKKPETTLRELNSVFDSGILGAEPFGRQWLDYHAGEWYRVIAGNMARWIESQDSYFRDLVREQDYMDPATFFCARVNGEAALREFQMKMLNRIGVPDAIVIGGHYMDRWTYLSDDEGFSEGSLDDWCNYTHSSFQLVDPELLCYVLTMTIRPLRVT
jgi:hypothetical protein